MDILTQKYIDRFWGNVDKERSNIFYNGTRCWEWVAGCTSTGYGQFLIQRKKYKPHRISYTLAFGGIPEGLFVLHHCDNPLCLNPSHLFLGTQKDNMNDKVSKGRQNRGESHYACKLTDKQVSEIRKRYGRHGIGGESGVELAKEFGVGKQAISDIVHYKTRAEISP